MSLHPPTYFLFFRSLPQRRRGMGSSRTLAAGVVAIRRFSIWNVMRILHDLFHWIYDDDYSSG